MQNQHRLGFAYLLRRSIPVLWCALAACSDSTEPSVPNELIAASSQMLSGSAGEAVAPSPAVLVKDQHGTPMVGVPVAFTITSGGGILSAPGATTDSLGVASVGTWTLGTTSGLNILVARVDGLDSVAFTANAAAGAPASISKLSGDNQSTVAGSAVAISPSVLVRDSHGNPVPGATVSFTPLDNLAAVSGPVQVTNESGIATVGGWQLPRRFATFELVASVEDLRVSFRATAIVGPAASLSIATGNNQTGRPNSDLNRHLEVMLRDANQNPVEGRQVLYAVESGGGTILNPTQTTNKTGAAALSQWSLGPVGVQTVSATVEGIAPVLFTATATPPVSDRIAFDLQDPSDDTSAGSSSRTDPPIYDLRGVRGIFRGDSLIIEWQFNVPIAPRVPSQTPTGLDFIVYVTLSDEWAVDRDVTGFDARYFLGANSGSATTLGLSGDGIFMLIPGSYSGNTLTARIAMARLEGDTGSLSLNAFFFSADGVVDRFPNNGSLRIAPTSGAAPH